LTKPKIDDFKIGDLIGVGNFGKVYKAENLKHKRISALKVLIKEGVDMMKHAQHIVSEHDVLRFLEHRNSLNKA